MCVAHCVWVAQHVCVYVAQRVGGSACHYFSVCECGSACVAQCVGAGPGWGILGTGMICNDFCAGLMANGSRIRAAAARDVGRAADFGARVGAEVTYGNYAALLEDQEVADY